ncbi:MAG: N-acetylmuramoyl-L-alanine amidase [Firmicutes bacterium]|nr:N-acetylmuramoyl-L-alanine amidase [Bacillota bacterium]
MDERARKKVVVDAGHGGEDPGTISNDIVEKDYTLKISQYINERLNDLNVESVLTRDSDITLSPNERPKKVQSFFGTGNDVVVLSNHINAGGGDGHCVTNV